MDTLQIKWEVERLRRAFEEGARRGAARDAKLASRYPCAREELEIKTEAGLTRTILTRPLEAGPRAEARPLYINLHGSGYVLGDAGMDDPYCRMIAARTGAAVANLDYRLAPEHPFPEAIEEVYAFAKHMRLSAEKYRIDGGRIAIGGQSAGGAIAAAVCLLARRRGELDFVLQVLGYPPLDLATDPADKAGGPGGREGIPPSDARVFNAAYLRSPSDAEDPLASPIRAAPSELIGLPKALVFTAGEDTLREEGERYAEMLRRAGVGVAYRDFPGCPHGFSHDSDRHGEAARKFWDAICDGLGEAFRSA